MGKPRQVGSVPNRPIYSRISFLYQAAAYLANVSSTNITQQHEGQIRAEESGTNPGYQATISHKKATTAATTSTTTAAETKAVHIKQAVSRRLCTEMRAASLKTQIRLSPAIKHTICKFCDTLLIEGETCTSVVENPSKGRKKPWADLLVITCNTCNRVRRYPVNTPRQKRRPVRSSQVQKLQPDVLIGKSVAK
ncbi:RNAse P Rpr2/Rpp21/SNM1 subunit domain-containing protein [Xylariales sp. PMI_506]|nr:RNAse P Rpr2/Rpp21/SNM1 subunit domain-containing protein [Xylariales sp. PMI_506]